MKSQQNIIELVTRPAPVQGHGHQRGRRSQIRSSQSPDPTALHVQRQDSDSLETITSGSVGQTTSKDSSMQAVPPSAAAPDGSVSTVAGRASTSREASPLTLDKDSVTQLPNRPSSSDRKKGQEAQRSSTLKPPTGLANITIFCLCFFRVKIIVRPFFSPVLSGDSSLRKGILETNWPRY